MSLAARYAAGRPIVFTTAGRRHGPITRLMSPHDVGQQIKPFVFLDHINIGAGQMPQFGFHPHSGIATLTLLLEGGFAYEDTLGAKGEMTKGAVEWMQAGGGVWHRGHGIGHHIKGYQLWIALPPELENAPPLSRYLNYDEFPRRGPARLLLGEWQGLKSPIIAPAPMIYLDVRLKDGEVWTYTPPARQNIAWISVHEGHVQVPNETLPPGRISVFEEGSGSITFRAQGEAGFVLGSATKHPYDLVSGDYSIHTNPQALAKGERKIAELAKTMATAAPDQHPP